MIGEGCLNKLQRPESKLAFDDSSVVVVIFAFVGLE